MFSGVLFDFNGVLVDDEDLHQMAFNAVLAPLGVHMSDHAYRERYLGFDDRGAFLAVLADHALEAPSDRVRQLIGAKAGVYAAHAATSLRVYPRAAETVRALAAELRIGIVSGALRSEIDGALCVMGIEREISMIVAAEDVTACKPDPEGYRLGRSRLGTDRVLAVEDSIAGIESALAAGIPVIAVEHTYSASELARAGATRVVHTIAELTPAVVAEIGVSLGQ